MNSEQIIKDFNKSVKDMGSFMDNLLSPEMQKAMTKEQKEQVINMKKEIGIIKGDNIDRKKELIKKYL